MATYAAVNIPQDDTRLENGAAIVDIGSNTIRCTIYDLNAGTLKNAIEFEYKEKCSLAEGISQTGMISEKSKNCALRVLRNVKSIVNAYNLQGSVKVIGTAPFRDAKNGALFRSEIANKTGLHVNVISGDEEAILAAHGAALRVPELLDYKHPFIVADMGGGSVDMTLIHKGKIIETCSLPLGTLRIKNADNPKQFINEELAKMPEIFETAKMLVPIGGTWRCMIDAFKKTQQNTARVKRKDFTSFSKRLAITPTSDLKRHFDIPQKRTDLVPSASLLIKKLSKKLKIKKIQLCDARLRDGLYADIKGTTTLTHHAADKATTDIRNQHFALAA